MRSRSSPARLEAQIANCASFDKCSLAALGTAKVHPQCGTLSVRDQDETHGMPEAYVLRTYCLHQASLSHRAVGFKWTHLCICLDHFVLSLAVNGSSLVVSAAVARLPHSIGVGELTWAEEIPNEIQTSPQSPRVCRKSETPKTQADVLLRDG